LVGETGAALTSRSLIRKTFMKMLFAGVAALALAFAAPALATEVATSSANSGTVAAVSSTSLGPAVSIGVAGATNTSAGASQASSNFFGPTSTASATTSTGSAPQFHAQTGFTIGSSAAGMTGGATAAAFAFNPF
jgi:hypothetical protein